MAKQIEDLYRKRILFFNNQETFPSVVELQTALFVYYSNLKSTHTETLVGTGELYSKEHSKRFKTENATLKLEQDKDKPSNIRFTINGTDIFDCFKLKQKELLNALGINPKERQQKKGL